MALVLTPLLFKYGHHPSLLFKSTSGARSHSLSMQSEDQMTLCPFQKVRISMRDVVLCANVIRLDEYGVVHERGMHHHNGKDAERENVSERSPAPQQEEEEGDQEGSRKLSSKQRDSLHQNPSRPSNTRPTDTIKILFLHDIMSDHSFLYQMHLTRLLSHAKKSHRNFEVIYFDWRGCGMSLGHSAHLYPHVKDLHIIWQKYEMWKGTTFVVANGLGALIFAEFERKYVTEVDGVILSGIPLQLGPGFLSHNPNHKWIPPRWFLKGNAIISGLASLLPYYPIVTPPIEWLVSKNTPETPPPTERARERYALDRFVPVTITAGVMNVWRESVQRLHIDQLPWRHVLILHARNDPVASMVSAETFHDQLSAQDKTLKIYEYEHHNILHEDGVDEFIADWIRERIPGKSEGR
eukprot:CAMPEP_0117441538 /NCGR_PEP_ID=MMETSP0759-20121206/3686_1 /TAXON_ID=63605 /ORGANISM="Percolomonas cosmopolitus, Strain WS" /LENGTH=408 /DNA_ID=CAMNT_0005233395 /DNA_START=250 /DNA_END=1476 /DNA_ORIENTATION=+